MLFFLLILNSCSLLGSFEGDSITIIQDSRIDELVKKHIQINEKNNGKISGYRVQILFSLDRAKAREAKANFLVKYPSVVAYEIYEQPNFKIRVGDFKTRLEAYKFLKEINVEFPGCFIVQDEIELKKME